MWNAGQLETHRPQNVHEKQTTSLFFGSLRNWSNKKSVSLHFIKGLMSSFTGSRTWVLNKQLAKFMNPWYSCLTGVLKSISSYRLGTFTPGRFVYGTAVNKYTFCVILHLSKRLQNGSKETMMGPRWGTWFCRVVKSWVGLS